MLSTEVMCAGLFFGTTNTSLLVANSTGLSTRCFAYNAAGCFGLAAANTSAGAPCSICISSASEPPNVYFALESIIGNTSVSDAAASTVGRGSRDAGDEDERVVVFGGLLPHPTASAHVAIAADGI